MPVICFRKDYHLFWGEYILKEWDELWLVMVAVAIYISTYTFNMLQKRSKGMWGGERETVI